MGKGRLEAFTDGVMAIIITIMVLEIKVPHGTDLAAFSSSLPILFTYALSFLNVGIFWNNHHHMLHAAARVDGKVLWANLFLLFWLSLIPFVIKVDRRDPFRSAADCQLWHRPRDGGDWLPLAATGHRGGPRRQIHACRGGWARRQR
jgi:uncharacterized membrane protein